MIANLWMGYDDIARASTDPDENGEGGHESYKALGDPSVREIFREDVDGPRTYELWSLYYEVDDGVELLQIRNGLNADFPGNLRTIGAWWTATGGQVMNVAGTNPQFPLHTRILEFMPDLTDEDGLPIGRPATMSDVKPRPNLGLGQASRDFTP